MFEDDDFSLDEESVQEELGMTYLGKVRITALNNIKDTAQKIIDNIKYNEKNDDKINSDILLDNFALYTELMRLIDADVSDEELEEKVNEIIKKTTAISFSNMDKILPDDDCEQYAETDGGSGNIGSDAFDY